MVSSVKKGGVGKMKKTNRQKTTIYVDRDLWRRAKIAALEKNVDVTTILHWAIEAWLKKGGKQ
jgi:post-segregation antitoxin (ccd killing protein)